MDAASSVCDISVFQTISDRDIVNSVSLSASVGSYPCDSTAHSRTTSYKRGRKSKGHITLKTDKGRFTMQIDTGGRRVNKQQMEHILRIIQGEELHNKGGKKSKKEEIENFIDRYRGSHNYNDVPVSTMRHIIPILLMEIYPKEYGQFSRKVKGMWERKPCDWPENVAFLDPNNKIKEQGINGSKPTKEVLVPMLTHLVRKYLVKKENATCTLMSFRRSDQLIANGNVGLDEETLVQLKESCSDELEESKYGSGSTDWYPSTDMSFTKSVFELDDNLKLKSGELSSCEAAMTPQYNSESSVHGRQCHLSCEAADAVAGIPHMPSNRSDSSYDIACLYGSVHSSQQVSDLFDASCHGNTPYQVEDDGEQLKWEPVGNVMDRITSKIRFLEKSTSFPESDLNLLLLARDMLVRSFSDTNEDKEVLIEKAHIVECVIDIIKLSGNLSVKWKQRLDDCHGTSVKEHLMLDDETGNILLSSNTESAAGASVLHQLLPLASDEDLVSQLNIEKRPTVGDALLANTDILQVRSDVNGSLENHSARDAECSTSAATYCSDHWQVGLQETAGASVEERVTCEVSDRNDEAPEIDLYNIDCDAILHILDTGMIEHELKVISEGGSVENSDRLQPTPFEDVIDGPPSSFTSPSTVVPDTFRYRLPRTAFSLPCTAGSSAEYSVPDFQLTAAAARPVSTTPVWKSHPVESGLVQGGLAAMQGVQQSGSGREARNWSLPASMPANSLFSSAIQPPLSQPNQVDMAPKTVTATSHQTYSFDAAVNAGTGLKPQFPAVTASHRVMSVHSQPQFLAAVMTPYSGMSVCSPVGQITGPMGDLSIDNDRHPLLRVMLTEAVPSDSRDQKNAADQKSVEDSSASGGKRSAPIPVMVEEVDFDDASFSGPSVKKVRPST